MFDLIIVVDEIFSVISGLDAGGNVVARDGMSCCADKFTSLKNVRKGMSAVIRSATADF